MEPVGRRPSRQDRHLPLARAAAVRLRLASEHALEQVAQQGAAHAEGTDGEAEERPEEAHQRCDLPARDQRRREQGHSHRDERDGEEPGRQRHQEERVREQREERVGDAHRG